VTHRDSAVEVGPEGDAEDGLAEGVIVGEYAGAVGAVSIGGYVENAWVETCFVVYALVVFHLMGESEQPNGIIVEIVVFHPESDAKSVAEEVGVVETHGCPTFMEVVAVVEEVVGDVVEWSAVEVVAKASVAGAVDEEHLVVDVVVGVVGAVSILAFELGEEGDAVAGGQDVGKDDAGDVGDCPVIVFPASAYVVVSLQQAALSAIPVKADSANESRDALVLSNGKMPKIASFFKSAEHDGARKALQSLGAEMTDNAIRDIRRDVASKLQEW